MNFAAIQRAIAPPIKILSVVLMASFIGLELYHMGAIATQHILISRLKLPLMLGHIVIASHAIEGAIAALYASSRGQSPWRCGVYTFWVGTIGLVELFTRHPLSQKVGHDKAMP